MKVRSVVPWLVAAVCLSWLGSAQAAEDAIQVLRAAVDKDGKITPYVLGPNDLIQLHVLEEDYMNVQRRLGSDGRVSFPLIESMTLAGLTVEAATAQIRALLAQDYLVDPKVTLTVIEASPRTFNIIGAVKDGGAYPILGESISLVDAIAMAGGAAPGAKLSSVTVTRTEPGRPKQVQELNVEKMIKDPRTDAFRVRPGDTIFVPDKLF